MSREHCHPLGIHRVFSPAGALPQTSDILDNTPRALAREILIDVDSLNITSGSFRRMRREHNDNPEAIAAEILAVVAERGKYQDRVMGSGGVLTGKVREVGVSFSSSVPVRPGDAIATLVSLSATPLYLEAITRIDLHLDQVQVRGQAILFESSLFCTLPGDLPRSLSMAVMDVAGAPAKVAATVTAGQIVFILGGGKAGLLCLYEAKKRVGPAGLVVALDVSPERCSLIRSLKLADHVLTMDASDPVAVLEAFTAATEGRQADFTVNVLNGPRTEMASILPTDDRGQVFFYNTATDFGRAALGAESVGKSVALVMGNGYVPGHAELAFQILRDSQPLREFFARLYSDAREVPHAAAYHHRGSDGSRNTT